MVHFNAPRQEKRVNNEWQINVYDATKGYENTFCWLKYTFYYTIYSCKNYKAIYQIELGNDVE